MTATSQDVRVLILGASGMLGNAMLRLFAASPGYQALGTIRSSSSRRFFAADLQDKLIEGIDATSSDDLVSAIAAARPHVLINCVGVVKQLASANDPLTVLPINAILPHRLARFAGAIGARTIHVSTDCVFSGGKGLYVEGDAPDASDLYGRSKLLGELEGPDTVTLRTSIIGHELHDSHGLVDWFLAQKDAVKGYRKAIFSGLPTCELARAIRDYVLPNPNLSGLYHVSADPIDKFSLLKQIAPIYNHDIEIVPDERVVIDRSLDSTRFRQATGFVPPGWPELIQTMHRFG